MPYLEEDGKVRRKWDLARTPYERLKQSAALSAEQQHRLDRLYTQTRACLHRVPGVFG